MKKVLIAILLMIKFSGHAQTLILSNEGWNCGGYTPRKATVVIHKGVQSVYFDWQDNGVRSWKILAAAKRFWNNEGTSIINLKTPIKQIVN